MYYAACGTINNFRTGSAPVDAQSIHLGQHISEMEVTRDVLRVYTTTPGPCSGMWTDSSNLLKSAVLCFPVKAVGR